MTTAVPVVPNVIDRFVGPHEFLSMCDCSKGRSGKSRGSS